MVDMPVLFRKPRCDQLRPTLLIAFLEHGIYWVGRTQTGIEEEILELRAFSTRVLFKLRNNIVDGTWPESGPIAFDDDLLPPMPDNRQWVTVSERKDDGCDATKQAKSDFLHSAF